jgi:hypothetical protein
LRRTLVALLLLMASSLAVLTAQNVPARAGTGTTAIGYWEVASDGGIFTFGSAPYLGSMGGISLNRPVVGMAATTDGHGYWEVASDGGIFTFGDAAFHGSTGAMRLNQPIVGMAADPATGGYWLVASDGGIFSFNAPFYGSMGGILLNKPVVGMAATPDGGGYWLVASDGGIFTFGDAPFYGSTGNIRLNQPIVGMASTPDGHGYWLAAADGGVFTYGDAPFEGSLGSYQLPIDVRGIAPSNTGNGYWEVGTDGSASSFGDAQYHSFTRCVTPSFPVVGIAAQPANGLVTNYAGNLAGPRVGVVGDSTTLISDCEISNALASKYAYQVRGRTGFGMATALPLIEEANADPLGPPQDWIVEEGLNDVGWYEEGNRPPDANWQTDLNNEINAVQSAQCVVMLQLPPNPPGADQAVLVPLRAAIANAVATHPNFHLLDWSGISLYPDGTHPTTLGAVQLAQLERQALDQDCPG